jgi:hypothetical protein
MFPDNKMRMLGVSSHQGANQDHLGIYRTKHHPYNFHHDCDGGGDDMVLTCIPQYKVLSIIEMKPKLNIDNTFYQNIGTHLQEGKNDKAKRHSQADMKGCRP